jgi:hypothetical protein
VNDLSIRLEPPDVYALQRVNACRALYRFPRTRDGVPACWRLDRPDERGELHLVSPARMARLCQLRLVRFAKRRFVPGSDACVRVAELGQAWCREFGWPAVWREWNELPLFAIEEVTDG